MKTWFKFYGQEYLSDPKMLSLSACERSIWVTILCLASASSEEGVIKYITEDKIKIMANVSPMHDEWDQTKGFLQKFENLGLLKFTDGVIILNNFNKRQETNLSNAERQERYRNKHSNVTKVTEEVTESRNESNARIDKNRIDKNIYILDDQKDRHLFKDDKKTKIPSEKQLVYRRIVGHLQNVLNIKVTSWDKQCKATKSMLDAGYTELQITKTIDYMANKDEWYSDKGFDMTTVAKQIPLYKAKMRKVAQI